MYNLHPGRILLAFGLLCVALPKKIGPWAGLLGAVLALLAMAALMGDGFFGDGSSVSSGSERLEYAFTPSITMKLLSVDGLSKLFGLIFCVIAVICGVYSFGNAGRAERGASLIYAGSSLGVVFAGDWISLIFFWEIMAIASCYLVWAGKSRRAVRASYRYLAMHLLGGNLLLAGAVILSISAGTELTALNGSGGAGYVLVLLGVCINAGVPPLHTWIPDAYPESTASGAVYMGSYTTKAAVYVLIRLFAGTEWLVMAGAVMAVFGACMALIENDLRRLLSYHIVSQLGMIVAALGTGEVSGIDGAALHSAYNILYKGVLLMGAGAVIYATGKRKITELGGLGRQMPFTAVCFLIASLSIAGMPFLNGFASKALIMESLHDFTAAYWLVTLAGVGTWLSITMKINYFVFWGRKHAGQTGLLRPVPASMQAAMAAGCILCIVTGVFPEIGYSLSPGQTMGHPFTAEHILEYLGMFVGATAVFAALLPKMAPHDTLTLDFDWFYRKWLAAALTFLSRSVYLVFGFFEIRWNHFMHMIGRIIRQPSRLFDGSFRQTHEKSRDEEMEDDTGAFEGDMPVGRFMQIFVVFCVVAFVVIMVLEQT